MKFEIHLKDPDGLYDSIQEAAERLVKEIKGITDSERNLLLERRIESMLTETTKWWTYGEYLTVEIDTEAKTCTVLERK